MATDEGSAGAAAAESERSTAPEQAGCFFRIPKNEAERRMVAGFAAEDAAAAKSKAAA